jgi:hypothetical protein
LEAAERFAPNSATIGELLVGAPGRGQIRADGAAVFDLGTSRAGAMKIGARTSGTDKLLLRLV